VNKTGVVKIELLACSFGIVLFIAGSWEKKGVVGNCSELSAQIECGLCRSVQHAMFIADRREGSIVNFCCTIFCQTWKECWEDFDSVYVKGSSCFPGWSSQQARCQQKPDRNSALLAPTPCGALGAWQESLSHPSLSRPILPPFPLNSNPAKSCPTLVSTAGFSVSADN